MKREFQRRGKMIKMIIEKLFCKHKYVKTGSHMENGGMCKIIESECSKCGKVKWDRV